MDLTITLLAGTRDRETVERPFVSNPWFPDLSWTGIARGPVEFLSFTIGDLEVARAMTRPGSTVGSAYPTFRRPPESLTELDLFEVRVDLHEQGVGEAAVALLLDAFPADYFGLSRGPDVDGFWQRIGWHPHFHVDAAEYGPPGPPLAVLFTPLG